MYAFTITLAGKARHPALQYKASNIDEAIKWINCYFLHSRVHFSVGGRSHPRGDAKRTLSLQLQFSTRADANSRVTSAMMTTTSRATARTGSACCWRARMSKDRRQSRYSWRPLQDVTDPSRSCPVSSCPSINLGAPRPPFFRPWPPELKTFTVFFINHHSPNTCLHLLQRYHEFRSEKLSETTGHDTPKHTPHTVFCNTTEVHS